MEKMRVLYITQEFTPFLPASEIATTSRKISQGTHENGKEIRVFMPRFGVINERRHQLHEVIRLSGMNMVINDTDHPLIIKVASVPSARMQVYFIDNEEYFKRKSTVRNDKDKMHPDNDERSMFFVRGVLETVKKLGWVPDVIHCHGWMSALMPLYVRSLYKDDPHFSESKIVYSAYESGFKGSLDKDLVKKLKFDGIEEDLSLLDDPTYNNLSKFAVEYSDAVGIGSENVEDELLSHAQDSGKPVMEYTDVEDSGKAYSEFYETLVEEDMLV